MCPPTNVTENIGIAMKWEDRGVHVFSLKCLLIIGGMQNTFLISQILKVDLSEDPIQISKRAPVSTSHTFRREDKKFRTHPLPTLFGHKGRRGFLKY